MNRRKFIQLSALGAGAAMTGMPSLWSESGSQAKASTVVAMPISIAPLVQRDLDTMFADMRQRAGVNVLFPFMYNHEPHRAGAPKEGFHGGNYATPHMQYYKDTKLTAEDMRAPEFGGGDILAKVIPAAQRHGIRTYLFLLEDNAIPPTVPHWKELYEVDHHGRRAERHPGGPCYNNPYYQNFMQGLVEDYARSYEIGGIMWGSERQSGFLYTLSISQSGETDPGRSTCFCEFCLKKAQARGIDAERARQGFDQVEALVRNCRTGQRPRDGHFSAFWRLFMNYPELLAWENLWVGSRHEFQAALYKKIKSVNPNLQVGWHVWHNASFSPFQRAEEDMAVLAPYSDFIRPALYNNAAGQRFVNFVDSATTSMFGDLPREEALHMLYGMMNYNEAPYDKLTAAGFSAQYVERETRRAVEGVAGQPTQIWPGVDIDVPVDAGAGHCTPESVGQAVKAAFQGGAKGIILSRNYIEMKPENLSGAGAALKQLGVI